MNRNNPTATEILSVEEAWIADWAAEGIAALERHLSKQAAFQDYLRDHNLDSDDGDRRTRA
jgi:hypothetical protein